MDKVEVSKRGEIVTLTLNGQAPVRFHAVWLRDNAHDKETRSPTNGQRLIALRDIPAGISISDVQINGRTLRVTFKPEDKTVEYDIDWLVAHRYDTNLAKQTGWTSPGVETWSSQLEAKLPTADFKQIELDKSALFDWLSCIRKYGFAKLSHCPVEPEALVKVVDLFGYVRETNYGKYFEVRTEVNPSNLAYTGLGLQAHTDNPYRDPVPTIQVLYCLELSLIHI